MAPKAFAAISPSASKAGVERSRLPSDQWACVIARIINDLHVSCHVSHEQLAAALNERGIPTTGRLPACR